MGLPEELNENELELMFKAMQSGQVTSSVLLRKILRTDAIGDGDYVKSEIKPCLEKNDDQQELVSAQETIGKLVMAVDFLKDYMPFSRLKMKKNRAGRVVSVENNEKKYAVVGQRADREFSFGEDVKVLREHEKFRNLANWPLELDELRKKIYGGKIHIPAEILNDQSIADEYKEALIFFKIRLFENQKSNDSTEMIFQRSRHEHIFYMFKYFGLDVATEYFQNYMDRLIQRLFKEKEGGKNGILAQNFKEVKQRRIDLLEAKGLILKNGEMGYPETNSLLTIKILEFDGSNFAPGTEAYSIKLNENVGLYKELRKLLRNFVNSNYRNFFEVNYFNEEATCIDDMLGFFAFLHCDLIAWYEDFKDSLEQAGIKKAPGADNGTFYSHPASGEDLLIGHVEQIDPPFDQTNSTQLRVWGDTQKFSPEQFQALVDEEIPGMKIYNGSFLIDDDVEKSHAMVEAFLKLQKFYKQ